MDAAQNPETGLARVRRVPRYGVFMALGAGLGAVVALILTFTGDGGPTSSGVTYSTGQVLGFAMLYLIPIGIALGAVVAIVLERLTRKNDRLVRVDHERIIVADDAASASDEV